MARIHTPLIRPTWPLHVNTLQQTTSRPAHHFAKSRNTEPEWIDKDRERMIDIGGFRAGVAAIEAGSDRPFATKAIILQYNLQCLRRVFPRALIIHTKRHPFFNIQSLLNARKAFFGDESVWFSVKPREYDSLRDLSPVEQVAGQVYYTRQSIDGEMAVMPSENGISLSHEDFCANPRRLHVMLSDKMSELGYELSPEYRGPASFNVSCRIAVDDKRKGEICNAYEKISGVRLSV